MRGSLVTLCSLATCAAQDHLSLSQAQTLPEPSLPPTTEFSNAEEIVPEVPLPPVTPEDSARVRLTPSPIQTETPLQQPTAEIADNQAQTSPSRLSYPPTDDLSDGANSLISQQEAEPLTDDSFCLNLESELESSSEETAWNAHPESALTAIEQSSQCDTAANPLINNAETSDSFETLIAHEELSEAESSEVESDTVAEETLDQEASQTTVPSPLERPATRLFNLETANQLSGGALQLSIGSHQTLPEEAPGTGHQLYYGGIEWGISDRIQLGLSGQVYDDPPTQPFTRIPRSLPTLTTLPELPELALSDLSQIGDVIPSEVANQASPNITLSSVAASLKLKLIESERFSAGLQGSLELLPIASKLFHLNNELAEELIGSVHLPMTYTASPQLQLHLTPGVSFLPDRINNIDFYDTVISVGTGVNWQPSERWAAYGSINLPIGPGGNTINQDLSIDRQLVWSVGTRYNLTPQVGVDLYATNGLGVTPATGILTSIPEGNELLIGARLNYAPDTGLGYRTSFNRTASEPPSNRDYQLAVDGLTLTTANTLEPGRISLSGSIGTEEQYSVGLAYSPSERLQLEAILENFSSGANPADTAGEDARYMVGARLQLLDQRQGAPVSASARVLGGRDADGDRTIGVLFAELPITYRMGPGTALFLNPKLAAFGDETFAGVGVGINQKLTGGLQLIGEITPVLDGGPVWAAGMRYSLPRSALSLDVYGTNAVGRNGLGTLIRQSETRLGVGLNWVIGR